MCEVKDKNGDVVGTIDMEGLIKQVYVQDNNNASTPAVYNLDYGYNTISAGCFEDKPDAEDYLPLQIVADPYNIGGRFRSGTFTKQEHPLQHLRQHQRGGQTAHERGRLTAPHR